MSCRVSVAEQNEQENDQDQAAAALTFSTGFVAVNDDILVRAGMNVADSAAHGLVVRFWVEKWNRCRGSLDIQKARSQRFSGMPFTFFKLAGALTLRHTSRFSDGRIDSDRCIRLVPRVLDRFQGDVAPLLELADGQETDWLEFKASCEPPAEGAEPGATAADYRLHVARAAVALANTRGGLPGGWVPPSGPGSRNSSGISAFSGLHFLIELATASGHERKQHTSFIRL